MNDTPSAAPDLSNRAAEKAIAEEMKLRNRFLLTGCCFFLHLLVICLSAIMQNQIQLPLLREAVRFHCDYQLPLCCLNMSGLWVSLLFAMHSEHRICEIREESSEQDQY